MNDADWMKKRNWKKGVGCVNLIALLLLILTIPVLNF